MGITSEAYHINLKDSKKLRNKLRKIYNDIPYECYVTGDSNNLELHHNYPLKTLIKNNTLTEEKLKDVVYLTQEEHKLLHFIFGRVYDEETTPKVKKYLEKRRKLKRGN